MPGVGVHTPVGFTHRSQPKVIRPFYLHAVQTGNHLLEFPEGIESFDNFVASVAVPIATGWNDQFAGRVYLPLKISAFARRTVIVVLFPNFRANYAPLRNIWLRRNHAGWCALPREQI